MQRMIATGAGARLAASSLQHGSRSKQLWMMMGCKRTHIMQDSHCYSRRTVPSSAFIAQQQQKWCTSTFPGKRSILASTTTLASSWSKLFRSFSSSSSSSSLKAKAKTYKIAVVGSGPSGCFTAKYLRATFDKQQQQAAAAAAAQNDDENDQHALLQIDIIERLPTPYGLVRYGVAPDHPEVKNVQNDFDTLFADNRQDHDDEENNDNNNSKTKRTTTTRIRFLGNVHVGRDVSLQELRTRYHAVVLATGCESNRCLNIPGEDCLQGILPAREFVAWYNGHPDFDHVGPIVQKALQAQSTSESENDDNVDNDNDDDGDSICNVPVVVIGQGNVALDCARILAKGRPGLNDTDIASRALDVIKGGVSQVSIVGRRGHVQGAFTIKELRELVEMQQATTLGKKNDAGAAFVVRSDELEMGRTEASLQELEAGRPKQRIDQLLSKAAAARIDTPSSKRVDLRFLLSPCRFEPMSSNTSSLGAVVCERTRLQGVAGEQRAVGTGEFESIPARLALVSIGYKGVAIPGMEANGDEDDNEGFFDSTHGVARHVNGRIQGPITTKPEESSSSSSSSALLLGGLYASGWFKRGPSGIIGTNIPDAKDTVATVLDDLTAKCPVQFDKQDDEDLDSLLQQRNIAVVTWEGYQRIVEKESAEKRTAAQPREKITNLQLQLETALGHHGEKTKSQ